MCRVMAALVAALGAVALLPQHAAAGSTVLVHQACDASCLKSRCDAAGANYIPPDGRGNAACLNPKRGTAVMCTAKGKCYGRGVGRNKSHWP